MRGRTTNAVRRRAVLAVLAAFCAAGCTVGGDKRAADGPAPPAETATPEPVRADCRVPDAKPRKDGTLRVTGCVAGADGKPVRAVVSITRKAGVVEGLASAFTTALVAGLSLGMACIDSDACSTAGAQAVARGKADGTFAVDIPLGSDVAKDGEHSALVAVPSMGVLVELAFTLAPSGGTELPPVLAWNPGLTIGTDGGAVVPRWRPLAEHAPYHLALTDRSGSARYLSVPAAPGRPVDPRLPPTGAGCSA